MTKINGYFFKRLGAAALALVMSGSLTGCNKETKDQKSTEPTSTSSTLEETEIITAQNIVEKSIYLIEEAARCGKNLDAEDAVLTVITANIDEISNGFIGKLFSTKENQTYTYGHLVDAYLRTAMMQVENIGVAKEDDTIFNIESIFVA